MDIKQATIEKLLKIQEGLEVGSEEHYQMSDLIDSLASSLVKIQYKRPKNVAPMPGACGVNVD